MDTSGSSSNDATGDAPAATGATPCQLTPTPADPSVDFRAKPGERIVLESNGQVGTIVFNKAEYAGSAVKGVGTSRITFTIVAGKKNLDVVYALTDPENGKGSLDEACDGQQFRKFILASAPTQRYRIDGQEA